MRRLLRVGSLLLANLTQQLCHGFLRSDAPIALCSTTGSRPDPIHSRGNLSHVHTTPALLRAASQRNNNDDPSVVSPDSSSTDDNKFGFGQRIASVQSLVLGAVAGSVSFAPLGLLQDLLLDQTSLAQFEFDTDMAAIMGGLFAIVYRYCLRQDTDNPQLKQGVIAAFALTRTLGKIHVPDYCAALPLQCESLYLWS